MFVYKSLVKVLKNKFKSEILFGIKTKKVKNYLYTEA